VLCLLLGESQFFSQLARFRCQFVDLAQVKNLFLLKFSDSDLSIVECKGNFLDLKVFVVRLDLDLAKLFSDAVQGLLNVLLFLGVFSHHVKV